MNTSNMFVPVYKKGDIYIRMERKIFNIYDINSITIGSINESYINVNEDSTEQLDLINCTTYYIDILSCNNVSARTSIVSRTCPLWNYFKLRRLKR